MNLQQFFVSKGYDISEKLNWDKNIELWESWYKGKVRKFHNYYIYNGQKKVKREKKSLQGAKKVAEDWADLLFNEKVKISLDNDESTKAFNKILEKNNGVVKINQGLERSFALGTGALVVSVQNMKIDETLNTIDVTEATTKIQFVGAKKIYPLSWEDNEIKECAFVTYKTIKGINYVFIAMHIINEKGNYEIQNYKFKTQNRNLIETTDDEKEGFIESFDTKNNIPWFTIIKPNICNNIDSDTPFGISVYANSIDVLKELDDAYNELGNEPILGRRRTFISEEMMTYDNGNAELTFDPEDISIYKMPKGFNKDSMIQHDSEDLRTDKLQDAVQFHLNILSAKVGFGQERYKFDGASIQTATGVISENSDMFRTLKKHEQVLDISLKTMIKAVAYASTVFGNDNIKAENITIDYDDSIIEDTGAKQVRAQSEVGANLRSRMNYMKDIRGLGEKQAQEELDLIDSEKLSNQELFGFPASETKIDNKKEKNEDDDDDDDDNKKDDKKKKEEKKEE